MQRNYTSDTKTERAVLGCVLFDSQACLPVAADMLAAEDFFEASHQAMFAAMLEAGRDGQQLDTIRVLAALESHGVREQAASEQIAQLTATIPNASLIEAYCERVRNLAAARQVALVAAKAYAESHEPIEDVEAFLDRVESDVGQAVGRRIAKATVLSSGEAVDVVYNAIVDRAKSPNKLLGVPTGLIKYDQSTGGLKPGTLTIVAGRPGMGKTAFALTVAANASKSGAPGLFLSLEMSAEELMTRWMSFESGIDSRKIFTSRLSEDDMTELQNASDRISRVPLFIDETPSLPLAHARHLARRWKQKHGIKVLYVDYLQLMRPGQSKRFRSREEEVAEISKGLKALSKELRIAVVALAQLNREGEKAKAKPKLSDLRESGAIEQDADNIVFIHREPLADGTQSGTADLILGKQRNGPTGIFKLSYQAELTRFGNYSGMTSEEYS